MRKRITVLLFVLCLLVQGCGDEKEITIRNDNNASENTQISYSARRFEAPFTSKSLNLERLLENNIGISMDDDGKVWWYTYSEAVKKQYISEAKTRLQNKQYFEEEWYEYRVWRYSINDQKGWDCEEVCPEDAVTDLKGLSGMNIVAGEDGNLYCVATFMIEDGEDLDSDKELFKWYVVDNDEWKEVGSFEVGSDTEEYISNISYCVDSSGIGYIGFIGGSIMTTDFDTNTTDRIEMDQLDYMNSELICNGKVIYFDYNENSVIVYDLNTNSQAKEIIVPDTMEDGGTILSFDSVNNLYILNRRGVYVTDIDNDDEFEKIGECDFAYYTDKNELSFDDVIFVDKNEFYYETTTWEEADNATNIFVQCKAK